MTTIKDLLEIHNSTMRQFEVLERADRLFAGERRGRYYGGALTVEATHYLLEKEKGPNHREVEGASSSPPKSL